MKSGQGSLGFTIVESLVVLAVSAAILVSALTLIGGSQQKSEFNTAVRDIQQQIDTALDNVGTGYTANKGNMRCDIHVMTGEPNPHSAADDTSTIGQNGDCIFIGKAMVFTKGNQYATFSVVGRRVTDKGRPVINMDEAKPVVADETQEDYVLKNGLEVKTMKVNGNDTNAFGFFSTLNSGFNAADNDEGSGTQSVDLVTFPPIPMPLDTTLPAFSSDFQTNATDFRSQYSSKYAKGDNKIEICFEGGSNKKGIITIGENQGSVSSSLDIGTGNC